MDLHGMKEIGHFVRRSENTVLRWIQFERFPAAKIGGIWISNSETIKDWVQNRIEISVLGRPIIELQHRTPQKPAKYSNKPQR